MAAAVHRGEHREASIVHRQECTEGAKVSTEKLRLCTTKSAPRNPDCALPRSARTGRRLAQARDPKRLRIKHSSLGNDLNTPPATTTPITLQDKLWQETQHLKLVHNRGFSMHCTIKTKSITTQDNGKHNENKYYEITQPGARQSNTIQVNTRQHMVIKTSTMAQHGLKRLLDFCSVQHRSPHTSNSCTSHSGSAKATSALHEGHACGIRPVLLSEARPAAPVLHSEPIPVAVT